jgi:hypothetical protein
VQTVTADGNIVQTVTADGNIVQTVTADGNIVQTVTADGKNIIHYLDLKFFLRLAVQREISISNIFGEVRIGI